MTARKLASDIGQMLADLILEALVWVTAYVAALSAFANDIDQKDATMRGGEILVGFYAKYHQEYFILFLVTMFIFLAVRIGPKVRAAFAYIDNSENENEVRI